MMKSSSVYGLIVRPGKLRGVSNTQMF